MSERESKAAGAGPGADLEAVVDALATANARFSVRSAERFGRHILPSREALENIVGALRAVLFPAHFGPADMPTDAVQTYVRHRLEVILVELEEQIVRGLLFACTHGRDACDCDRRASEITDTFAQRLPAVRELLGTDVDAAYLGDPAATSPDEAVFCYPGVAAITYHRLAHELYRLSVPLIPRIVAELAHGATGIDIHPGATIADSFFIDHGTGVVIGETAVIGRRVRLYQGVTLGARSFPADESGALIKGRPRHPIIEDDVTIYAGATILGRITIGRGSSIGGNVWVTRAVPPGSRVSQAQAREESFDAGGGI